MKKYRAITGYVLAMMFWVALSIDCAASHRYSFRHIDNNDGLPANIIKCMVRDRHGFMWFGTSNGLNRYDGSAIKELNCYDEEAGRGNNNIGSLYEDENGLLWIGTDRGIYRYDPYTDRISYVDLIPDDGIEPNNWVQHITGDRNGNVWAVLPDVGVYRYHDGKVTHFAVTDPDDFKKKFPSEICVSSDGNVWVVTTGDGIFKYDSKADRFNRVRADGNGADIGINLCCICETPHGTLIVSSSDGYFFEYDPSLDTIIRLPFSRSGDVYLRCMECFGEDLWIGTQIGMYVYNMRTGHTVELKENPIDPFSLSDDAIYCIYRDNDGGAWVGTMFGGVNYMSRRKFGFMFYGRHDGLSSRLVHGLATDGDGNVWVGTENSGVIIFNPATGRFSRASGYNSTDSIVLSITSYKGDIYAGFSRTGLYKANSHTRRSVKVFPDSGAPGKSFIDNNVYAYCIDHTGCEWVGLGFALYRRKSGESSFSRVAETGFDWCYHIMEASDGTIWIGTMGNGIWKHNPADGSFRSYVFDYNDRKPNGLRSNSINSIMEDSDHNIWFSTDRGGLSRYDAKADRFVTYGKSEGLPDDVAYSVLEDNSHHLWFGTNRGLVRFSPSTGDVQVFSERDGIPFTQYNYKSAIKGDDGTFYMGGISGIIAFRPDDFEEQTTEIPIFFTGLTVLNKEERVDPNGHTLKENILYADRIKLAHDRSTFTITVASPDFNSLGRLKFSYRLLPVSNEWINMSSNRISFTNLAPGKYTLEVRAENGSVASVRALGIQISPPWWLSVWALLTYCIVAVVLLNVGILWYRHRSERRLREREKAYRDIKEKELYRSKLNFFTEIAHEIRTPLSLIDLPLEAIEEIGIDNPDVKRYLKVTRQNTQRLLELTGQLFDFVKIDSKRLTLKSENVNINSFICEMADRFEPSITLTGKHLVRDFDKRELTVSVDREALTKIVSNLLNNALKYGTQTIRLSFKRVCADDGHDNYIISVASDGKKIAANEQSRIFQPFYQTRSAEEEKNGVGIGLPLSRSLATLLGGTLELEDNVDELNIFTLTLPVTESQAEASQDGNGIDGYMVDEGSNQTKMRQDVYSVLFVEDNEAIASFLAEQLRKSFLVEIASNGAVALEMLKGGQFDIVVTDIMMPVMDGLELCRRVKADIDTAHIPVVFITAKNDLDTKVKGLQLGGEAFVEKPFSIKYLKQLLQSLLDNRRRERESFSKNPFFSVKNMQMNKTDEEFMNKVCTIIEENVSEEDFNVEAMCDLLAMSRSSLLRKIKMLFNLSPVELIRVIKLKKAAELICEGAYRISDVCYMVGIASPSYFSKLFFKQFGMTPKDFEKQYKSKMRENPVGDSQNPADAD